MKTTESSVGAGSSASGVASTGSVAAASARLKPSASSAVLAEEKGGDAC